MSVPPPIPDIGTRLGRYVPLETFAPYRDWQPHLGLIPSVAQRIHLCLRPVGLTLELNSEERLR